MRARVRFVAMKLGVACLLSAGLLASVFVSAAQAAAPSSPEGHISVVLQQQIPMNLDCSTVPNTPVAQAALHKYGLCGHGKASGVTPNNSVAGNCGTLSLYTYNALGGWMTWRAEITSSQGPFITASYSGSWANYTRGNSNGIGRSFAGLTSDWLDIFPIQTLSGTVFSRIGAAGDILWWGGSCLSAGPVDNYVTVS
jgi:hypothetical protein